MEKLIIHPPEGEQSAALISASDRSKQLSEWLGEHQMRLNTRCGQRGLCRGCQVEMDCDSGTVLRRSCQIKIKDLPSDLNSIRIPTTSWSDQSLHGVSLFELNSDPEEGSSRSGIGMALDIGTTTVAGALWDLSDGKCLATASLANAQGRYGDNVLARINHAVEKENGIQDLQKALVQDSLLPLLKILCQQSGLGSDAITEANASGNTVMLHTLAGEPLVGMSKYPFKPVFLERRLMDSKDLGYADSFQMELLPSPGPFVGADITSGVVASGMLKSDAPELLIDFGTNGEIILKHNGRYLATATAAGPAFEGGRLTCGAAAKDGVISSLKRTNDKWEWILSGKSTSQPNGLSGAAYVDFIAEAKRAGLVNSSGRYVRDHPEVVSREEDGQIQRLVNLTKTVYVTEPDIAELIQAKAAIAGGVMTLLELAGLEPTDLGKIYISGGFGYYLDLANAMEIGLIPEVPMKTLQVLGNSSLGGASLLLISRNLASLQPMLDSCEVVELNQTDCFEDHFIDAMVLEAE